MYFYCAGPIDNWYPAIKVGSCQYPDYEFKLTDDLAALEQLAETENKEAL